MTQDFQAQHNNLLGLVSSNEMPLDIYTDWFQDHLEEWCGSKLAWMTVGPALLCVLPSLTRPKFTDIAAYRFRADTPYCLFSDDVLRIRLNPEPQPWDIPSAWVDLAPPKFVTSCGVYKIMPSHKPDSLIELASFIALVWAKYPDPSKR